MPLADAGYPEASNVGVVAPGMGQPPESVEEKDTRYQGWERTQGVFERSLPLPRTVNAEAIRAEFADGILTVVMPKVAEAKGRKIEVRAK